MSEHKTKAFKDALDKFIYIGNCFYNKKHNDNVINIFNDMEPEDRRTLLLGVYHIYSIVEYGAVNPVHADIPVSKPKPDDPEEKLPVLTNHEQSMLDLKLWFAKILSLTVLIGMVGFFLLVFYISQTAADGAKTINSTFKVLSLLFS